MTIDRTKLRWNGWGWNDAPDMLGDRADAVWGWMAGRFGLKGLPSTPPKDLADIALPALKLGDAELETLRSMTAPERVKTDNYERAFHARGKGYQDLIDVRAGRVDPAPDAVVYPTSAEEVLALVRWAEGASIALVPYGGGSSVVGGVNAIAGENQTAIVTLDLTLMSEILEIDEVARTARVQPGIYGPDLEAQLQERGYTLGHYPQSFEFSTLGGWIAHRGAGQQSNKYGKAEKWFVGAELATPRGMWKTEAFPASAAGPQLNELIVGSEGALGVITEATVKLQPVPAAKDYRGYIFQSFEAGVNAIRETAQSGVPTAMLRLSDEDETFFFSVMRTAGKEPEPKVRFCLMLVGLEGTEEGVESSLAATRAIMERNGGMHAGDAMGESWYEGRFLGPYLRDPMLDRGLGVETLETSTRWSNMMNLHALVKEAIRGVIDTESDPGGIVMAHVSHSYTDGASLYFTFAFARDLEGEMEQWLAIKRAASNVLLANGGTISHHHGAGVDHAPWIEREKGPIGVGLLRAIKAEIDPGDVLNPGKLFDKS